MQDNHCGRGLTRSLLSLSCHACASPELQTERPVQCTLSVRFAPKHASGTFSQRLLVSDFLPEFQIQKGYTNHLQEIYNATPRKLNLVLVHISALYLLINYVSKVSIMLQGIEWCCKMGVCLSELLPRFKSAWSQCRTQLERRFPVAKHLRRGLWVSPAEWLPSVASLGLPGEERKTKALGNTDRARLDARGPWASLSFCLLFLQLEQRFIYIYIDR